MTDSTEQLYRRQPKNRGGPLEFAVPGDTVWSDAWQARIPAELAALPEGHFEPFRTPVWNGAAGRYEPAGSIAGWRLTSRGRSAADRVRND
jgi:hypothetical protein